MQDDIYIHVIDDDDLVRESVIVALRKAGFAVRGYTSADSFLVNGERDGLGCVVTDVNMPGMNGVQLVRTLKSEGIAHPVIVISGAADINLAVEAMRAGAIDFLAKPFRGSVLAEKVRAALDACDLGLMSSMLKAITSGEIEVHYQPKLDMKVGAVVAAEALVRWRHPVRGMIGPDVFIPAAEKTGHVRALTEFVLDRVIEDQATLARAGHTIEMAVNISGRTLGEPDFADFAAEAMERAEGAICFEITETAVMERADTARWMLERFRKAGIGVAIDDFGAGLSSLRYVKEIPAKELKIDKSIVRDLITQPRDALVAEAAIGLAHSLGMTVTVEGVESDAVLALLARMGCDEAQGYLIARPCDLNGLIAFLSDPRRLTHVRAVLGLGEPPVDLAARRRIQAA